MDVAKTNRDPCYTISTSSWDGIHTTTTTPNWRKINLEFLLTDNIIIITLKPPQNEIFFFPIIYSFIFLPVLYISSSISSCITTIIIQPLSLSILIVTMDFLVWAFDAKTAEK